MGTKALVKAGPFSEDMPFAFVHFRKTLYPMSYTPGPKDTNFSVRNSGAYNQLWKNRLLLFYTGHL